MFRLVSVGPNLDLRWYTLVVHYHGRNRDVRSINLHDLRQFLN